MDVLLTSLEGVLLVEPDVFHDNRGYFTEIYKKSGYNKLKIERDFVQDNLSYSIKGVIRGLHYQVKQKQAKLIKVISGEIFDVAVDLRPDSPNFGKWESFILSDKNNRQIFIPEDFAHGFCVLSDEAEFLYYCTDYYHPQGERGIIWNDPDLAIPWPMPEPLLSAKDRRNPRFRDIARDFSYNC